MQRFACVRMDEVHPDFCMPGCPAALLALLAVNGGDSMSSSRSGDGKRGPGPVGGRGDPDSDSIVRAEGGASSNSRASAMSAILGQDVLLAALLRPEARLRRKARPT